MKEAKTKESEKEFASNSFASPRRHFMKGAAAAGVIGLSGFVLRDTIPSVNAVPSSNGVAPSVLVTPQGPTDGGNFGPNTPGTITAGIQEAINSLRYDPATLQGGGSIILAPGVYPTSASITLYPGMALGGIGQLAAFAEGTNTNQGTCVIQPGSFNSPVIQALVDPNYPSYLSFPWVHDLAIAGPNGANDAQDGIYSGSANGVLLDMFIDGVSIFQVGGCGINMQGAGKFWIDHIYSEDNRGSGVQIGNTGILRLTNSYIFGNGFNGINAVSAGFVEVMNNNIWNNAGAGMQIWSVPSGCQVLGNSFTNNGGSSFDDIILLSLDNSIYGSLIANNIVAESRGPGSRARYAINISFAPNGVYVCNNVIIGTFGTATYLLSGVNTISAGSQAIIRNNQGINPIGLISSPFDTSNSLVGLTGGGFLASSPSASTVYTCHGVDVELWISGGTSVSLSKNGTSIQYNPTLTLLPLCVGDTVSFGGFTGTVTVICFGK